MSTRMTVLEGLFPDYVRCVMSEEYPARFELLPEESACAAAMSPRRRRDFTHGRSCARLALAGLGYRDCAVPVGADRAPVWPDGVVGSISHCDGTAAAAVAHDAETTGIGLDIESSEGLEDNLLPMICRREERARLEATDAGPLLAKLIFSAKESVFKCVWPAVRRFVDFQEVEVRLDLDGNTFSAVPHAEDLPADLFAGLRGRFGETGGLLLTAAYGAAPGPTFRRNGD
jgi:4'-phosphopantetheinyl transferase EntD